MGKDDEMATLFGRLHTRQQILDRVAIAAIQCGLTDERGPSSGLVIPRIAYKIGLPEI